MVRVATIESDDKVQLPHEWVEEIGLRGIIALEKATDGIVVRRCSDVTWDEVFAVKLRIGSNVATVDSTEVSGDDYFL